MNAFMDNKQHEWIKADICLPAKPPNRRLDSRQTVRIFSRSIHDRISQPNRSRQTMFFRG
jgi:hypothetical protein